VVREGVFVSLRVVKVGAGDTSWESRGNVWGFLQQRRGRWSLVSTLAGFFFIQEHSYAFVLSLSTGGLKSQPDFHLDLCPVASWHKQAERQCGCEITSELLRA
jgi:hypothetical protein